MLSLIDSICKFRRMSSAVWQHPQLDGGDSEVGLSLDLVKRPIETATPVHILPPCSHFLDMNRTFLIALNLFSLCGTKTTHTHHGHHRCVVVIDSIHFFTFFVIFVWCIRVEIRPGLWLLRYRWGFGTWSSCLVRDRCNEDRGRTVG